jgi:hypothetical protein
MAVDFDAKSHGGNSGKLHVIEGCHLVAAVGSSRENGVTETGAGWNGTELRHVWDENEHGFRVSFR